MNSFIASTHIASSLGLYISDHWKAVLNGKSGLQEHKDSTISDVPFCASRLSPLQWQVIESYSHSLLLPFESLIAYSIKKAIENLYDDIDLTRTGFVLSTTKGNIKYLGRIPDQRLSLHHSAALISSVTKLTSKPIVISNACASGVIALLYGHALIQEGRFDHVIVSGGDTLSKFVMSGFESFKAISYLPCRPFDADRKGINLGEAAATIILNKKRNPETTVAVIGGASSNDANHISGPSRTGDELAFAIRKTIEKARISVREIGQISSHGTATEYNDEMESKAFQQAGLSDVPLHSFKGYVGHTLGAAGIAETAILAESMNEQVLIPSLNYESSGVSGKINVTRESTSFTLPFALKTASGFGGINAALLLEKLQ